jgi:type I restriction enzyme M protein
MRADGLSLDDKRQPISENDIPDILKRWQNLEAEKDRQRTEQSFFVPKAEIAAQGYNLRLNRYKEVVHEEVEHVPPQKILEELDQLEQEIQEGLKVLKEMFPSTPHVSFAYREQ